MATKDPISDTLLQLFNSYADTRQAQLDLERAYAAERHMGRTAIPGVMAQLQQNADKEAARKAKLAKQSEQQAPSPQSMVPPLTDMTGQMTGRSSGQMASAASEIFQQVTGGRGVKASQVGTVLSGAQGAPAQAGAAAAQQAQGGAPVPPVQPATGPPGSVQPIMRDLSGVERGVLAPLKVVGGALTRNAPLAIQGVSDIATGREETGQVERIPTVAEQAAPLAEPLAAYIGATYNSDPLNAARARQLKDQRLAQIEQEFGPDVRESVEIQAFDKYMVDEEARQREAEDPVNKKNRFVAETQYKLGQKVLRGESLTAAEQAWLDMGKRAAATTIVNNIIDPNMGQLTKATINKIQGETVAAYPIMQTLDEVERNFYEPGFTRIGKAQYETLKEMDKSGVIPEAWKETLKRFHNNEQAVSMLTVARVTEEGGKTFTPTETEAIKKTIIEMGNSPTGARESLAFVREQFGLSIFRNATLLGQVEDPRFAQDLGSTRTAAQNQARALMLEYQNQGLDPDAAFAQVSGEYRNRYGLDLQRLMRR